MKITNKKWWDEYWCDYYFITQRFGNIVFKGCSWRNDGGRYEIVKE